MAVVQIDLSECINCSWCRRVCPTETIKYFATGHRTHVVEPDVPVQDHCRADPQRGQLGGDFKAIEIGQLYVEHYQVRL